MDGLEPPKPLRIDARNLKETWETWISDYELYAIASGLAEKSAAVQYATFLHVIGESARAVYRGFQFADADASRNVVNIRGKFAEYCTPKKNEVYERYTFNQLVPAAGESIDSFVATLRQHVKDCGYGTEADKMIRDRIVFTYGDARVREKLISTDDLTLAKAIEVCRAAEATRDRMQTMSDCHAAAAVHAVRHDKPAKLHAAVDASQSSDSCGNCGRHHEPKKCPAYDQKCSNCRRRGHFARCCRQPNRRPRSSSRQPSRTSTTSGSGSTRSVNAVEDAMEAMYVGELVTVNSLSQKRAVYREITINNTPISVKLDTGAECSVMSLKTFNTIPARPSIAPTDLMIKAYGMRNLVKPVGEALLDVAFRDRRLQVEFVIIDTGEATLLGLDACEKLGLIKVTDAVESTPASPLIEEYADVFTGIGAMPGEYSISVDPTVRPVIQPSRKVPLNLKPKLRAELDRMEQQQIICKRSEPTDWVSALLTVEKPNGQLRVCLDPRPLNKAIKREHFQIPTFDDVICQLHGKRMYTIIDMRDGFWHVQLDDASSKLCTFNTPFGRYSYRRLPFGLSSSPEVFQRKNYELFGDIPNVYIVFDDIIIAAADDDEHDTALRELLERARKYNVRFNRSKIQLKVSTVRYLGHIVSADGIRPDPSKVRAIVDMPTPSDRKALLRFLGMVTFVSRWLPGLADMRRPLTELLKDDVEWNWTSTHQRAVDDIKKAVSSTPVLRYFDPTIPAVIQTDASSTGLGSVLLQDDQPVAYVSRALTDPETRWAQIEKELMAIVFAVEKFEHYIYGRRTVVHSDHRPLQSIFAKPISQTTARLQRMLIRLAKFDLEIVYRPGKRMYVADALSRAYLPYEPTSRDLELTADIEVRVHSMLYELPASNRKLDEFRTETAACPELSRVRQYLREGFPVKSSSWQMTAYSKIASDIIDADGILLHNDRIIVPVSLRESMLKLVHEGHLGVEKSKSFARTAIWWPGMSRMIADVTGTCATCCAYRRQQPTETLMPHPVPNHAFEKIGADIFTFAKRDYLLVVDYFSKFPFIFQLHDKTASSVITSLKSLFSIHGVPVTLFADNMPFAAQQIQNFAATWGFEIVTSSPNFAQSNGQAERAIQTVKNLFRKAHESHNDLHVALLNYRATPLTDMEQSPAELLFSRQLRTKLPLPVGKLVPKADMDHRPQLVERQNKYKKSHDSNRHARDLPPLKPGDVVRVKHNGQLVKGEVVNKHEAPRSYIVKTTEGSTLRRNRRHLIVTGESRPDCRPAPLPTSGLVSPETPTVTSSTPPPMSSRPSPTPAAPSVARRPTLTTRSGRSVKPPVRFADYVT
jgi:RNase H-like domain found in reverse transcriptase/Reverse transcriptase (RNA-dependent DNA polymerase)/Integrase zinc binding domain/Retroviral aspartyl protease